MKTEYARTKNTRYQTKAKGAKKYDTKKKDGKVSFYWKNTNSRIEETLGQSDGIIEEIETF